MQDMNMLSPVITAPEFSVVNLVPAEVPEEINVHPLVYNWARLELKKAGGHLRKAFEADLPLIAAADPEYDASDTEEAQAARTILLASEAAMFVEGMAGFLIAAKRAHDLFPEGERQVCNLSDLRGAALYGFSGQVRSGYGVLQHAILANAEIRGINYTAGFLSDAGKDSQKETIITDQGVEKHKTALVDTNLLKVIEEPLRRLPPGVADKAMIISSNTEVIEGDDKEKVKLVEDPKVAAFRETVKRFADSKVILAFEDRVDLDIGHPNAVAMRFSLLANGWPKF
jgi:hypothetical protein